MSLYCAAVWCSDFHWGVLLVWYFIGRTLSPAMQFCIRLPVTTYHNIRGDILGFKALGILAHFWSVLIVDSPCTALPRVSYMTAPLCLVGRGSYNLQATAIRNQFKLHRVMRSHSAQRYQLIPPVHLDFAFFLGEFQLRLRWLDTRSSPCATLPLNRHFPSSGRSTRGC